jgi:hypothetical protein
MIGLHLSCEWWMRAETRILYLQSGLLFFILFLILCISTPYTSAAEDANAAMMREIIDSVSKLCSLPSQKGELLEYSGSGEAGVIIRFVGVKGEGHITRKEWEGLQDVLESERAADRPNSRECSKALLPVIMKAYGVSPAPGVSSYTSKLTRDMLNRSFGTRINFFDPPNEKVIVNGQLFPADIQLRMPDSYVFQLNGQQQKLRLACALSDDSFKGKSYSLKLFADGKPLFTHIYSIGNDVMSRDFNIPGIQVLKLEFSGDGGARGFYCKDELGY